MEETDEQYIYVVEVLIKNSWQPVTSTMAERRAKEKKAELIDSGLDSETVRITKSEFRFTGTFKQD